MPSSRLVWTLGIEPDARVSLYYLCGVWHNSGCIRAWSGVRTSMMSGLTPFTGTRPRPTASPLPPQAGRQQEPPEPLLLVPARSSKQEEGESSAASTRTPSCTPTRNHRRGSPRLLCLPIVHSVLPDLGPLVPSLGPLSLGLGHEVFLLGQLNADGVLFVPHPLPGQALGNQVDLWGRRSYVRTGIKLATPVVDIITLSS